MIFDLTNYSEKKLWEQLSFAQQELLKKMLEKYSSKNYLDDRKLTSFFLPFIQFGLEEKHIDLLMKKVPNKWPLDLKKIFFDFRMNTWLKYLEPPTLEDCLKEYLANAPNRKEALTYIRKKVNNL